MTTTPEGPDESRPAHAGYDGELPPGLVIPDDARDLEFDRKALLRERKVARRRARVAKLVFTRRWYSHGISGPIVVLCLMVVFVFAVLLALMVPNGGNGGHPALPLATSTEQPGVINSRLPEETLMAAGLNAPNVDSGDLRPGVVMVLPAACTSTAKARSDCTAAIANAAGDARDFHYQSWLIGSVGNRDLATLAEAPSQSTFAIPLFDTTGQILKAFPAVTTPTVIFIDAHGLVQEVDHDITGTSALTPSLERLEGVA